MEDFQMYSRIQQEKQKGFSKEAAARHLNLNWRTVDQYWEMALEDYEAMRLRQYTSGLDSHREVILSWLRDFEDVSAAQIQDWLSEHYSECYRDRTVRDYVLKLRKQFNLPRQNKIRDYGPIPELPPGQQMQADFGVYNALRDGSRRIRLFFVIFILAHSRYKYIVWQTRHFTTQDFVRSLESCFEAIGGIPQELVIDQDRLMTVNENYGDVIFTQEFERCKKRNGFAVWLCRKSDPESKGMVESGVKYVKYNFARNRYFFNLGQWSKDCGAWLVRTGNGKKHEETKKIPAEVFQFEKGHLKPVIPFTSPEASDDMVTTPVQKNNSIRYRSSRYSVPTGTYNRIKKVMIREKDGLLEIYNPDRTFIDAHVLAAAPGEKVINRNHARDTSARIQELRTEVLAALGDTAQAEQYLQRIQKTRHRYLRDQFQLILNVAGKYEPEILRQALLACLGCDSDSATDFKDFANHLFRQITIDEIEPAPLSKLLTESPKPKLRLLNVRQHAPAVYQDAIRKGGQTNG